MFFFYALLLFISSCCFIYYMDQEDIKQTTPKTSISDDSQACDLYTSSCSAIDNSKTPSPSSSLDSPANSSTKIDLNKIIAKKELVCIKLYRDDCPYCVKIKKDFEKIESDFPNVSFIYMSPENAEYKDIRSTYNIATVPAFIVFVSSKPTVIVGSNKLQEVRDLLEKQTKAQTADDTKKNDLEQ